MTPEPAAANIAQAIQEVSEKAQLLVREEIELAKAEVTAEGHEARSRAPSIGAAAGRLRPRRAARPASTPSRGWPTELIPFGDEPRRSGASSSSPALLLLLAALAGFLALRAFKAGAPPTPKMAIDEAKLDPRDRDAPTLPKDTDLMAAAALPRGDPAVDRGQPRRARASRSTGCAARSPSSPTGASRSATHQQRGADRRRGRRLRASAAASPPSAASSARRR